MGSDYETFIGNLKPTIFSSDIRLKSYIRYYTFYEGNNLSYTALMTPVSNGAVELFLHFDESYIQVYQNNRTYILNNYVVGLNDALNPLKVRIVAPKGKASGVIIRFAFSGVYRLMGTKIADLSGTIITIEDLWGYQGKQLREDIISEPDNEKRVRILDDHFLKFLSESTAIVHLNLDTVFKSFTGKFQNISVDNLAEILNMSYRSLHRKFCNEIGMSPKEYLKIIRFDRVCQILSKSKRLNLCEILYYGGYYDQAHFIHEFKEIMRITPRELLRQSNGRFYVTRGFRIE